MIVLAGMAGAAFLAAAAPLGAQEGVVIEHDHLIVESGPFALRITDIAMVQVAGPGPLPPGRFQLPAPARAENLRLVSQGDAESPVAVSERALVNRLPLAAGRHQFQFQYELVDAAATVRVTLPRLYRTEVIDILLPSGPLRASAPGLAPADPFEIEGRRYERLSGAGLAAGQPLVLTLERPSPPERRRDPIAIGSMIAVALFGCLLVLRSVWLARAGAKR